MVHCYLDMKARTASMQQRCFTGLELGCATVICNCLTACTIPLCQTLSQGLLTFQEDAVTVPAQVAEPEAPAPSSGVPSNKCQKVSLPNDPFYGRVTKVFAMGVKCELIFLRVMLTRHTMLHVCINTAHLHAALPVPCRFVQACACHMSVK